MEVILADITSCIERIEPFEEKSDVVISSYRAVITDKSDYEGDYIIQVSGEMMSSSGRDLEHNIELIIAIYDGFGTVIKAESIYIRSENFMGLEIFDRDIYVDSNNIQKIRIYPKKY